MSKARKETPDFVAYVYENDYQAIQELVQQYPNIETGGDLFGLWKDEKTVIIQQFIGPGKKCKRTTTSFHQDIEYLHKVGSLITTEEGLCNVGEWHSHHQIGMPEPSAADRRTVFSNMPHLGLERFVLFIACVEGTGFSGKKRSHDVKPEDIKLRPFLFLGSTQKVVKGEIEKITGSNPHRLNSRAEKEIENGKEPPPPKYIEDSSGSQKQGKNKKEAPIRTEKTENVQTLKQQAKPRVGVQERHGQSGSKPPAESSSDDESVGGKPQDDQQRRRREQDQNTGRNREGKGNQTQRSDGFNNENRSPNTGPAAPRGRDFQSLPPTSQMNTPLQSGTTQTWGPGSAAPRGRDFQSLPTSPTSQMNTPLQSGTTQTWGPGTQGNVPSAPTSFRQVWDASSQSGTAQGQGRGVQRNIPPSGGAYSSPQSPQHPSYIARDPGHGAQHSSQAQAKDRSGTIPVGKMGAGGYF